MNTMYDRVITKMDVADMLLLPAYNAGLLLIYDKYFENMLSENVMLDAGLMFVSTIGTRLLTDLLT